MAKILFADDDGFQRFRVKRLLSNANHEMIEAINGEEAVEKYKSEQPDLTILDIRMPVLDGLEALQQIMAYDKNAKVIMMSSIDYTKTIEEAKSIGIKQYIVKPFKPPKLLQVITEVLAE